MATEQQLKQTFPDWYEKWLFRSLGLEEEEITSEEILKPLLSLNNHWLQENYNKEEYSWDSSQVAKSYALYYMTANIPKLWVMYNHSKQWQQTHLSNIIDITEYGCGPGTFLWAYLFYLHKHFPEQLKKIRTIKGVDHSSENLQIAHSLYNELIKIDEFSHINAVFKLAEWQEEIANQPKITKINHMTIFGNSLIESSGHMNILETLNFGNLLILEPGTNKHFQRLRNVRDKLVDKNYTIHFPCPQSSKCPMPENNWCHFNVNRFLMPFMQKISNAAGRRNHKHHFSGFIFSKQENQEYNQNWRILSSARKAKGSVIRFLCDGKSVKEVVLNKKEKSDQNRDFIKAETGALGQCSSKLKNKRLYKGDSFKL
ncbi:MAG: small ribosomal subunit Rsm22 family protein [Lentisphaerales bacterium]|nr:small ribosomal subunit Rsm22 family protein [Lentisphaerales bacterium]